MKAYGGMEVYLHAFLNLALDGYEWLALCSAPDKDPQLPIRLVAPDRSHSWPGHFGEIKTSILLEIKPQFTNCPAHGLLTMSTLPSLLLINMQC
jgi:hypothetical protein